MGSERGRGRVFYSFLRQFWPAKPYLSSFVRFMAGKMAFNDMSKRNGV